MIRINSKFCSTNIDVLFELFISILILSRKTNDNFNTNIISFKSKLDAKKQVRLLHISVLISL